MVHVLVRTGNQTKTVKPQEPPVPDQAPAQQTASSKPIEHERTRAPKEAINDEPEKPKVMLVRNVYTHVYAHVYAHVYTHVSTHVYTHV